ncbi:hypothetical protein [Sulfolobus monocaudavirus SMV3]|uniref:hypothetical protein n=1 Tax=Sulfolobus monocaudavirus SMV3 TaxID=1732177 RepID=UPI000706DF98|nr:hypothetical protein AXI69_gp31 [Sulfolobus monocaudavirus SMV3]ALG96968.1 hypothetical protein [Sulfolobus monocaudavirus SMV3]
MSLNPNNNKKQQQQQQEPVYEVSGATPTPSPPSPPLFTPLQQTQQQPQLSPLGKRNIVKVDPNLVRQAIREKSIIPTRQVTQKEAIQIMSIQEILNNYVLILTKDLKSGSLQFYGTPYNVDETFQILLSILTDRFSSLATDELSEKFSELQALISSDANYDDIIAKLNQAHKLVVLLLLAFERSIMEVGGVTTSKMRVEMLSPLEIAQTLGITPISTDRL